MRPVSCTKWGSAFVVLGLSIFLNALSPPGAQANVITNGDFSTGTLEGWNASGDLSIQNMSSLPAELKDKWDLSSWNSVMNGNFLLLSGQSQDASAQLSSVIIPFSTPSVPVSFSFDYAIAWNVRNYASTPAQLVDSYIPISVFGENPRTFELQHYEISWNDYYKNHVITGSVKLTNFAPRLPSYDAMSVSFYAIRPGIFDAIVGFDNFNLEVMPIDSDVAPDSGPAPVPEPATCVLLMISLAGTAWYTRKRSTRA